MLGKKMRKHIIFTGGGSAGHVIPNLAIIKKLPNTHWEISYIGSKNSIEQRLAEKNKIAFYAIETGKLRRYFSWKNFIDPIKIFLGTIQAFFLCRQLKADVIFSKGGYVAFPVVIAAWLNRIPVVVHESDLTPGLANRLSHFFATKICLTFAEGDKNFREKNKLVVTGTPLRSELFSGKVNVGHELCNLKSTKPTLLIYGGGQGSVNINQAIRDNLKELLEKFNVIHLCGNKKVDPKFVKMPDYIQFEYIDEELPDLLACADIVISRAGANSIYELIALQKPHILIPLSKQASRGDQILNAKYFQKLNLSYVIWEEKLSSENFMEMINYVYEHRDEIKQRLVEYPLLPATDKIVEVLEGVIR